jgi:flagellar export protein FliJ
VSGIETAARVAALREKAARARFGTTGAALRTAEAQVVEQQQRLAGVGGPGANSGQLGGGELHDWHATATLRAAAARSAEEAVDAAQQDRAAALAEWQDLSRRREALDEVLRRWRAAQRQKADKDAQRMMDDLAKRRKDWS